MVVKKLKVDGLDIVSLMNGLVFFAPVALLVRTRAGVSTTTFFVLQALLSIIVFSFEIPAGKITDYIGYRRTIILSQILLCMARVLLLIAFISENLAVFVVEAIIEGLSICFSSGTQSAYLYTMMDSEQFVVKSAHLSNCGTVGFIISTIAYAGIYTLSGIKGLLIATIIPSIIAVLSAVTIKSEERPMIKDKNRMTNKVYDKLWNSTAIMFMLLLSCISIGYILINFFYAEKIMDLNLQEQILTPIILGYSAIQLLSEKILSIVSEKQFSSVFILSFACVGVLLILFGVLSNVIIVIAIMLILPLSIDIPAIILDELQNKYVDEMELEDKRAELLSVFNMGVNLIEIVFLFGSAVLVKMGISISFVIIGIVVIISSLVFKAFSHGAK